MTVSPMASCESNNVPRPSKPLRPPTRRRLTAQLLTAGSAPRSAGGTTAHLIKRRPSSRWPAAALPNTLLPASAILPWPMRRGPWAGRPSLCCGLLSNARPSRGGRGARYRANAQRE